MSVPKESKYAAKLCELGFTRIDKNFSVSVRAIFTPLSRNERRLLARKKYRPWFTAIEDLTFATDDTGQTWKSYARVDLAPYGFEDQSDSYQKTMRVIRNTDTELN